MSNTKKSANKNNSKRQTEILIGIAFIVLACVFVYFAVSQPSVNGNEKTTESTATTEPVRVEDLFVDEPTATEQAPQASEEKRSSTSAQTTSKPAEAPTIATSNAATQTTASPTVTVNYPLNLNTCTAAELMTIDGIGEARAGAIIAYRDYLGGYTDVKQLKNISGIGDGIFAKIEPYVTV